MATRAEVAGTGAIERHLLLQHMGDLVLFRLAERRSRREDVVEARRVFRGLQRALLDGRVR
jgi:hypothetical protein